MDKEFTELIIKYINKRYVIELETNTLKTSKGLIVAPHDMDTFIETTFDVDEDVSYMITVVWLTENGFKNIRDNWGPQLNFNGAYWGRTNEYQQWDNNWDNQLVVNTPHVQTYGGNSIILGGTNNLVSGSNSIAIGSNNQVSGNNSVAIGNNITIENDNIITFKRTDGTNISYTCGTDFIID